MKLARPRALSAPALLSLVLLGLPACDGDDDGDSGAGDTGSDTEAMHADHGDHEGGSAGTDGADPDTMVEWTEAPPASVAAGTAVEGTFMVHTEGELHVTEMRACMGHGVADCGLGAMDTFETVPAVAEGDAYHGSLELDAGDWTVVGYAHVGPDPFVSDSVDVTVE